MSGTPLSQRQRIERTQDLASIVHTMKVLSASKIDHYDEAVRSLEDYYRTIVRGLSVCFRKSAIEKENPKTFFPPVESPPGLVVFGTDLGLVGQFNEALAKFIVEKWADVGDSIRVWAVGEHVYSQLLSNGIPVLKVYRTPTTSKAITPLVGELLLNNWSGPLYIVWNRRDTGNTCKTTLQRMLPLDEQWMQEMASLPWINKQIPEVLPEFGHSLSGLIREYLFVSLFKACVESLAAENTVRLAAMQRAEKNISELLKDLKQSYHRARQEAINEELFDIIAGYEALRDV